LAVDPIDVIARRNFETDHRTGAARGPSLIPPLRECIAVEIEVEPAWHRQRTMMRLPLLQGRCDVETEVPVERDRRVHVADDGIPLIEHWPVVAHASSRSSVTASNGGGYTMSPRTLAS